VTESISIAVGVTRDSWDERFASAIEENIARGEPLRYEFVDLERHDWIARVEPFQVVLWKPGYMGTLASHLREKIYFLEKHLGKLVFPNYETVWHFESKVAQSYLFSHAGVRTPDTVATFDHRDAQEQLDCAKFPLVFKLSGGAASRNVRLIRTPREAAARLRDAFCGKLYREATGPGGLRGLRRLRLVAQRWFWDFLRHYLTGKEPPGCLYWQEYLPDNEADLRITVIGDCYAYGFWRKNRPGDFRASGSGRLDFQSAVPEAPLHYCLELNRRFRFDSMAYDILFKKNEFVVSEMSYGYLDSAPYRTAGYYERREDGTIEFVPGHVWPQSLWATWAIRKAKSSGLLSSARVETPLR
jgi:glutathione synthase/RimK-type ligase-like ATP-grasp enzyme